MLPEAKSICNIIRRMLQYFLINLQGGDFLGRKRKDHGGG
jgi:hypothetical protein